MGVIDQLAAKLPTFEGSIPFMYRDTMGKVTVGAGDMLPNLEAAQALPFLKSGVTPATPYEIAVDFARVMQLPFGQRYAAGSFRSPESLTISNDEITLLLTTYLAKEERCLSMALPCYPKLPDKWKLALLDMAYNLGIKGLVNGFPHLISAVESGNWQCCMAYCNRPQLGINRNTWTRDLFEG